MKIVLSERMKRIADLVTPGRVTADIGCDHGLVSAYLIEREICPKVYALDVAQGPLNSAKKNTSEYSDRIELRLSDGFEALEKGETQCAIITGMGGHLILSILEAGMDKMEDGYELVLSPQSDIFLVRKYLCENGFEIVEEDMLKEDGKYYVIIKAVFETPGKSIEKTEAGLYYGEKLIEKKSPVLKEYLEKEIEKRETLFCRLSKSQNENTINRLAELRKEVETMSKVLDMMR